MPACEWEPTPEQKIQHYQNVLEGKVVYLGGHRALFENGKMQFEDITPEESWESAIVEALDRLGLDSYQASLPLETSSA